MSKALKRSPASRYGLAKCLGPPLPAILVQGCPFSRMSFVKEVLCYLLFLTMFDPKNGCKSMEKENQRNQSENQKKSISEIKEIKLTLFEKINYNQRNQNQYEKHEVY